MSDLRLELILGQLHPEPGTKLWHGGATLVGALNGLTPQAAAWRPAPDKHCVWELALHAAYWNYAVRRRITEEPKGGFPRSPANWPAMPAEPMVASWKMDRLLVRDSHIALTEAIRAFDPSRLDDSSGGNGATSFADLLMGAVLHDTYHAGQIQVLKGLYPTEDRTP